MPSVTTPGLRTAPAGVTSFVPSLRVIAVLDGSTFSMRPSTAFSASGAGVLAPESNHGSERARRQGKVVSAARQVKKGSVHGVRSVAEFVGVSGTPWLRHEPDRGTSTILPSTQGYCRGVGFIVPDRDCEHHIREYHAALYPRNSCNRPSVFVTVCTKRSPGAPFFSIRGLEEDGMNGLAESVADRGPDSLHQHAALLTSVRAITVKRRVAGLLQMGSQECAR